MLDLVRHRWLSSRCVAPPPSSHQPPAHRTARSTSPPAFLPSSWCLIDRHIMIVCATRTRTLPAST